MLSCKVLQVYLLNGFIQILDAYALKSFGATFFHNSVKNLTDIIQNSYCHILHQQPGHTSVNLCRMHRSLDIGGEFGHIHVHCLMYSYRNKHKSWDLDTARRYMSHLHSEDRRRSGHGILQAMLKATESESN